MDSPVRLFGRLNLQQQAGRRVESIRLRVQCTIPAGSLVKVTDVQLQPGRYITGWTLNAADLGVLPVTGWAWRNAVVSGARSVVVAADVASASPTVWDVRGTATAGRVGAFVLGPVSASARVDGFAHSATQGAGIPPHLTARSDVDVPVRIDGGRALVCCWFRGLAVPADTNVLPPAPPHTEGTVTGSHPSWGAVIAHHDTWTELRTVHPDWS